MLSNDYLLYVNFFLKEQFSILIKSDALNLVDNNYNLNKTYMVLKTVEGNVLFGKKAMRIWACGHEF